MSKLPLTIAVSRYDHVTDVLTGAVPVEGIDLNPLDLPLHDIFFRFIHFKDFDVAELSMAKYVSMISQGDDSLIALPVFPSRVPRHSAIYVRRDGPVKQPADLAGRRVGVPEWAQTAGVYARGLLMHEFGVDLASIEWCQAGEDQPGRREKVELKLPPGVTVRPCSTSRSATCWSRASLTRSWPRSRRGPTSTDTPTSRACSKSFSTSSTATSRRRRSSRSCIPSPYA